MGIGEAAHPALQIAPVVLVHEDCEGPLHGASLRVGLRPGTPDDLPIVGPSQRIEGLIYATGHYRNGALLTPLKADAVAELVGGAPLDSIWTPCDPQRFGLY